MCSASWNTEQQRYNHSPQTWERRRRTEREESCLASGTGLAQEQTQADTLRLNVGESRYHHSEFRAACPLGIQRAEEYIQDALQYCTRCVPAAAAKCLHRVPQHVLPRAQTQWSRLLLSQKFVLFNTQPGLHLMCW